MAGPFPTAEQCNVRDQLAKENLTASEAEQYLGTAEPYAPLVLIFREGSLDPPCSSWIIYPNGDYERLEVWP